MRHARYIWAVAAVVVLSVVAGGESVDGSTMSPIVPTVGVAEQHPEIAAGGGGVWVSVWDTSEQAQIGIARSSDNGMTWNVASYFPSAISSSPHIAADGDGNWIVVWETYAFNPSGAGGDRDVAVSRSTDDGLTWSSPTALYSGAVSDCPHDSDARVGAGTGGNWVVTWQRSYFGCAGMGQYTARSTDEGASWSPPSLLTSYYDGNHDIATDGAGNWIVVTAVANGPFGSDPDAISFRSSNEGATWTGPAAVSLNAATDSSNERSVRVAAGGGKWMAIWYRSDYPAPGNYLSAAVSSDNGATWTGHSIVGSAFTNPAPDVAWDGTAWGVAWEYHEIEGEGYYVGTAFSTNDGGVWSPVRAAIAGGAPSIAVEGGEWRTAFVGGPSIDVLVSSCSLSATADADGDEVTDECDNCPIDSNGTQADLDGDGLGNPCDPESDGDGVASGDNCPLVPNPAQQNSVHPATFAGDACEDPDADGEADASDNCPDTANATQENADGDSLGDACDPDDDNDGEADVTDLCPQTATAQPVDSNGCSTAQVDADADGVCNPGAVSGGPGGCGGTDLCAQTGASQAVDSSGCSNAQVDPDGDDVCSPGAPSGGPGGCAGVDNCPGVPNADQADADNNGIGDACDIGTGDADGDGYSDIDEAGRPLCATSANEDSLDDIYANDGCPVVGAAGESSCQDIVDSDSDGYVNDGCIKSGQFSEGQFKIGTAFLARCGVGANPSVSAAWPSDIVSGGVPLSTDRVTITDLTSFLAPALRLNSRPGQPNFNARWDLRPGPAIGTNWIQINDLTSMFAGSSGYPPMNNGNKVFGQPFTCTAHPVYGD